jgi:O-acetyl-ADP-ribose deacetylase (regulator of RNase III)
MHAQFGACRLELVEGDITCQSIDAIVNAANESLSDGSGVNGAIQRAAGPALLRESAERYPAGCPTGSAVATGAGNLPARFVFHAVGPVWRGGNRNEALLLKGACLRCLELAVENNCAGIAFPAISTGVFGYPKDLAAEVALTTTRDFLAANQKPPLVRFVLFDAGSYGAFARVLESLKS